MTPLTSKPESFPVFVSGYYGFDNLGDEAILQSILQWFSSRRDIHPVVLSAKPKETFDSYGVDSISRTSGLQMMSRITSTPIILQGGGGLLQDATSFKSLAYYLSIMLMGFVTGRKVVAFGQGIGPLDGEFSPYLAGEFLSQCDFIAVRDFRSFAFCQARIPVTKHVHLMADPALLLEPAETDLIEDIYLQENIDLLGSPLICYAVKGSPKDRVQITALARSIDMINDALGGGVLMIPFHHPDDVEYAKLVKSMIKDTDSVAILEQKYRPAEVLGIIGKCDMVVGMRLHSLIFAANRGVPFVALSYDPKIDEFAGEFGFKPAVHTPLVGPEKLVESIEDVWESRGRIKAKVTETSARLKERAISGFKLLDEYIDSLGLRRVRIAREVGRLTKEKKT